MRVPRRRAAHRRPRSWPRCRCTGRTAGSGVRPRQRHTVPRRPPAAGRSPRRRRRAAVAGRRCPGRRRAPSSAGRRPRPRGTTRRRRPRAPRAPRHGTLDPPGDRGLQPGEREVVPVRDQVLRQGQPAGNRIAVGSPSAAARSICGPPGYRAARAAVRPCRRPRPRRRRSSRRAVPRRRPGPARAAARCARPRPAARPWAARSCCRPPAARPPRRGDQVVHPVERLAGGDGERLRSAHADHERSGQARSGRDGHGVELVERHPGLGEGAFQGGRHRLEVRPRGDLGTTPP